MRLKRWAAMLLAQALTAGCATTSAPRSESVAAAGKPAGGDDEPVSLGADPGAAAPVTPLTLDYEPAAPLAEVSGFDLTGPLSCLPLAPGRRCLERADPLVEACRRQSGEVSRCEDCRSLCSKDVSHR